MIWYALSALVAVVGLVAAVVFVLLLAVLGERAGDWNTQRRNRARAYRDRIGGRF